MGQKTERIRDLESRLGATQALIRTMGNMLGVKVGDDVTPDNMARYVVRFTAAIQKSADDDDDASPVSSFDDLVDQEVDRMNGGGALVPAAAAPAPIAVTAGERDGLQTVAAIARELNVQPDGDLPGVLTDILAAIQRIKNPGDVGDAEGTGLAKGDSLVDAIKFGRDAEHHLRDELAGARSLIGRIAGALQIPNWVATGGEEILERVQRWEGIKHLLRKRIIHFSTVASAMWTGKTVTDELRAVLLQIVGPSALAKLLEAKPKVVVTPTVLAAAEIPPVPEAERKYPLLTGGDLDNIIVAAEVGIASDRPSHPIWPMLKALRFAPPSVRTDLLTFLNLVTLPSLERL